VVCDQSRTPIAPGATSAAGYRSHPSCASKPHPPLNRPPSPSPPTHTHTHTKHHKTRHTTLHTTLRHNTTQHTPPQHATHHATPRRSEAADVLLEHPSASREHAVLQFNGSSGAAYLIDRGSTHGSFLNKRRLAPHAPAQLRCVRTREGRGGGSTGGSCWCVVRPASRAGVSRSMHSHSSTHTPQDTHHHTHAHTHTHMHTRAHAHTRCLPCCTHTQTHSGWATRLRLARAAACLCWAAPRSSCPRRA
jgi:hypothetical protein